MSPSKFSQIKKQCETVSRVAFPSFRRANQGQQGDANIIQKHIQRMLCEAKIGKADIPPSTWDRSLRMCSHRTPRSGCTRFLRNECQLPHAHATWSQQPRAQVRQPSIKKSNTDFLLALVMHTNTHNTRIENCEGTNTPPINLYRSLRHVG